MKDLRLILNKKLELLTWDDLLGIVKQLLDIYESEKKLQAHRELDMDFVINDLPYYRDAFSCVQPLVEDTLTEMDFELKVQMTDDLANVVAFLSYVHELDDGIYKSHENDLYFEFVLIIGNHYLTRIYDNLGNR